jgi:hypothetical protein
MASGDWQIILETRAERDLGRLGNPALIREAREVIDDLQFDPVQSNCATLLSHNPAPGCFVCAKLCDTI